MFSVRIRNMMELEKMVTAPSQTTVAEAARLMAASRVGAVMVVLGSLKSKETPE